MATDEADAALDYQGNGFAGVLKEAETNYSHWRKTRRETSIEIKYTTLPHAYASVHTFLCVEGGYSAQLLLGDHVFVLFPLFVLGFQTFLGCKGCVV